jgi:hypothetical protein
MFCALGSVFADNERSGSSFHILPSRIRFWLYRARRVQYSCFALPDIFSTAPSAPSPVFLICAPVPVFDVIEGVGPNFQFLRSHTRFRLFRARRVRYSGFALRDMFSAVSSASGPVFMFCALVPVFDVIEGVGPNFQVWRFHTRFRLFHARRVRYSGFALLDIFSVVSSALSSVFMFCAPEHVFVCTDHVGSRFHVFGCTGRVIEGVGTGFHVLPT